MLGPRPSYLSTPPCVLVCIHGIALNWFLAAHFVLYSAPPQRGTILITHHSPRVPPSNPSPPTRLGLFKLALLKPRPAETPRVALSTLLVHDTLVSDNQTRKQPPTKHERHLRTRHQPHTVAHHDLAQSTIESRSPQASAPPPTLSRPRLRLCPRLVRLQPQQSELTTTPTSTTSPGPALFSRPSSRSRPRPRPRPQPRQRPRPIPPPRPPAPTLVLATEPTPTPAFTPTPTLATSILPDADEGGALLGRSAGDPERSVDDPRR